MAGYVGNIPVPQGTQTRQSFTATASQTSFPTIGYTAGFIDVYLNGVKLIDGTDFTASNGSDVVLTTAASANDVLNVVIFDTFDTSSGTFSATTLKNNVTLKNDTEQDTDGGRASKIIYQGEQSGGEISTLAEIEASHDGTADDEKGDLIFRTNDGSDGTSPTERLRIDSTGKSTFKDDVGIEGATPTLQMYDTSVTNNVMDVSYDEYLTFDIDPNNARGNSGLIIKADGTEIVRVKDTGRVGIGTTTPSAPFDVTKAGGGNYIAHFQNTTDATPYGVVIKDASSGANGYPLLQVTNAAGSVNHFRVNSGNGYIFSVGAYNNTTSNAANMYVFNSGDITRSTSSRRYKNTIQDSTVGLAELNTLRPVSFKGNNDGDAVFNGLIAEEVHDAGLTQFVEYDDEDRPDALRYPHMVSLCIKAIQELSAKVDALETENTAIKSRLDALEAE